MFIIEIDLTIGGVDVSTNVVSSTITANNSSAQSYQWVNCDNGYQLIAGETMDSYTPVSTGNYAVIITDNGCTDTSACTYVSFIGIEEIESNFITIYPNPSNGLINISSTSSHANMRIFNSMGQLLLADYPLNEKNETIDLFVEFLLHRHQCLSVKYPY